MTLIIGHLAQSIRQDPDESNTSNTIPKLGNVRRSVMLFQVNWEPDCEADCEADCEDDCETLVVRLVVKLIV